MRSPRLLLMLKAHVSDHDRRTASGAVVHVKAHETKQPSSQTVIPSGWNLHKKQGGVTHFRRELPVPNGRRRYAEVHHFDQDDTAQSTGSSGFVKRHPNAQAAFDHLEDTEFRKRGPG